MRFTGTEKLEIIRLVEQSHLPARRTLEMLGIRPSTFYRWYERYRAGGPEALEDKPSKPDRIWNRIPDEVRERIVAMALEVPELSPRELATRFTDTQGYFVSESSVYRLLKALDLITSPAFIVIKAADEFKDKTTAPNRLWHGWPCQHLQADHMTLLDRFPYSGTSRLFAQQLLEFDQGKGWARIGFEATAAFLNPAGYVQGGILISMLDDTTGPALWFMPNGE